MHRKSEISVLIVLLFITFVDFMGLGLVYPIFSKLLFDTTLRFLPFSASNAERGFWLGVLFSLMPLVQFFSLPIWGTISDKKGRKGPLFLSLIITSLAYGAVEN